MIIIGEKINGSIPAVKRAIDEQDEGYIRSLAIRQVEAGADYIDVCAGTAPEKELATLKWLMDIVQDSVTKPLCIDSPNARVIEQVFQFAKEPGIINSVSEEEGKWAVIYPLIQGTEWQVIALACDDKGIPADVNTRVNIARSLVEKAADFGIGPEKIHIDPLVMALSTDNQSMLKFVETMRAIKRLFPSVKVTSGLSNISFGMPLRKVVNQHFFALAIYEGMDSAIMDPLNREMTATLFTIEALLGKDRHCRNFANAYRKNKIGPVREQ
ncbi:MAG: methyltetrahydrofolate cobalamin methyltransferase [Syntrophomonadaceae bacterium]|nr:methyltetrahydrofolate cobalamin methyltransferase [Syntrophomonadaceae bacterium]